MIPVFFSFSCLFDNGDGYGVMNLHAFFGFGQFPPYIGSLYI